MGSNKQSVPLLLKLVVAPWVTTACALSTPYLQLLGMDLTGFVEFTECTTEWLYCSPWKKTHLLFLVFKAVRKMCNDLPGNGTLKAKYKKVITKI